jgi:iron complex outermembrane receptor protein
MIDYSFNGFNDFFLNSRQNEKMSFFNPKAGIIFLFSESATAYFSAGIGHKEPVRDDFVNSIPANRPEPEHMIDYETGFKFNSQKFTFNINAYYMNYLSQLILTGKINEVGEYNRESVENSYRAGIELETGFKITTTLNLYGNLTLSRNRISLYKEFVDDYDGGPQLINEYKNSPISFSPDIISSGTISYLFMKNFNAEWSTKFVSKQYLDNTGNSTRKINPYSVNDFRISYSAIFNKVKMIAIRIMLNNILNAEYTSNGYTYSGITSGYRYDYNYYFPQAKFNWLAGIELKF